MTSDQVVNSIATLLNAAKNPYGGFATSGEVQAFDSNASAINYGFSQLNEDSNGGYGTLGQAYDRYNGAHPGEKQLIDKRSGWAVVGSYNPVDKNGNSAIINGVSGTFESVWVGEAGKEGESLWSKIWNSPIARYIVPDDITLSGSFNVVPLIGFGGSYNVTLLTRGQDAGVHFNHTWSFRVGFEMGASGNLSDGWYNGDPRKATYNSLLGLGGDASAQLGVGVGVWGSFGDKFSRVNWTGVTVGIGPGFGGSVGGSNTIQGW